MPLSPSVYPTVVLAAIALPLVSKDAIAQIVPDASLPENSIVTPQGAQFQIDGGTAAGTNLFHSFDRFDIPTGNEAFFNNAPAIDNIISRVTGDRISTIDGLIRANGNINLYFINPNGIVFGENASIDLGGAFFASSADSIIFADSTEYSANSVGEFRESPLLSVSVPVGLQLGTDPGTIAVRTHRMNADGMLRGLDLQPMRTLSLVGGNIVFDNGIANTPGGNIELAAGSSGTWMFGSPGYTLTPSGNVALRNASRANTDGMPAGNLLVAGRSVLLQDGSTLSADNLGGGDGGIVTIVATELLELSGVRNMTEGSRIVAQGVESDAGDIIINTGRLVLRDGGEIASRTRGDGDGGSLTVRATEGIEILGASPDESPSILSAEATPEATGRAGNVTIATPRLLITNGGGISTTGGNGDGGNIEIVADNVELAGISNGGRASVILSEARGAGQGGTANVTAQRVLVRNGALVSVEAFGSGAGGELTIAASESVTVTGIGGDRPSTLSANTRGSGSGGRLQIQTPQLRVSAGGRIAAETFGTGNGGTIDINAEAIDLVGELDSQSSILVQTFGEGNAGDLTVTTDRLTVSGGSFLSASTLGAGEGGNLNVTARAIELLGTTSRGMPSGLQSQSARDAMGNAGNLVVQTETLRLENGANITVNGEIGDGGDARITATESIVVRGEEPGGMMPSAIVAQTDGVGRAGNVTISTPELFLSEGGVISATTRGSGEGGRLNIEVDRLQIATGGRIATESLSSGNGGQIDITATESIALTAFGEMPENAIVARSDRSGAAGSVTISTPELLVSDGAEISVSNEGTGDAGNLNITADTLFIENGSQLRADTEQGGGGNITLSGRDIRLRENSSISTNAGNTDGGNIFIDTSLLVALENSDITANALAGTGGRIVVVAEGIFGTAFRNTPTRNSDITATSSLGAAFEGTVDLQTPDVDPSSGLVELETDTIDVTSLVDRDPCSQGQQSEFTITGRGGLPPTPEDAFSGSPTVVNWTVGIDSVDPSIQTEGRTPFAPTYQEATTWTIAPDNRISLVAEVPVRGGDRAFSCHESYK